jgi:hypothetical protein
MSTGIEGEIITTTVAALLSGGLGYAFREYRNRVRPFFQITAIDGSLTRRSDNLEIDPEISQKIENTFYIKPLSPKSDLGEIWDHWDRADDVKRFWPSISQVVDEILSSTNDNDLTTALGRVFEKTYIDRWLMLLLVNNRFIFPQLPEDSVKKVDVFFEDDRNGMVWFNFPNTAPNFGNNLNHGAIRARCQPFIDMICHVLSE